MMPIPVGVYVAVSLGIGTGGVAAYLAKKADGQIEEVSKEVFDELLDQGVDLVEDLAGTIGSLSLQFVEGFGEAVVKGLDRTADYIKNRFIRGKEPDIVAGFTVTVLTIGAAIYLYNSVKNSNDAF